MEYKLLFLDVDGTLLWKTGELSTENKESILRMSQAGYPVTITSGRNRAMTRIIAHDLQLDKFPKSYTISLNGAHIYNNATGETIKTVSLERSFTKELFTKALKQDIHIQCYSEDAIYLPKETDKCEWYRKAGCECIIIPDVLSLPVPPLKILLIDSDYQKLRSFRETMMPYTKDIASSEFSSLTSLEYTSLEASKGLAMEYVTKLYNAQLAETIAVGDGENDLSMLRIAGLSIAPSNALSIVKEQVSEVSPYHCKDDAVAHIIKKYFI